MTVFVILLVLIVGFFLATQPDPEEFDPTEPAKEERVAELLDRLKELNTEVTPDTVLKDLEEIKLTNLHEELMPEIWDFINEKKE